MIQTNSEKIPIGVLSNNQGKLMAARSAIDPNLFSVFPINQKYDEIQGNSLEIAGHSAVLASEEYGITVIREDHSIHFDGLAGLPGPYAKYAEAHLGVDGLIQVLRDQPRTGRYMTTAVMSDPAGGLIASETTIEFTVSEQPRGDLQDGWAKLIMLDGEDRTLAEYPEADRVKTVWSDNYRRLANYLVWRQARVLYITGPHASGKTEAALEVEGTYGYPYIDLGPSLRKAHQQTDTEMTFEEWLHNSEASYGEYFTDNLLTYTVNEAMTTYAHPFGCLVIGSRSAKGLMYINDAIEPSSSFHIHLAATKERLYERYCIREGRTLSPEEFEQKIKLDECMGLGDLEAISDITLHNNQDRSAFRQSVKESIDQWNRSLPNDDVFWVNK